MNFREVIDVTLSALNSPQMLTYWYPFFTKNISSAIQNSDLLKELFQAYDAPRHLFVAKKNSNCPPDTSFGKEKLGVRPRHFSSPAKLFSFKQKIFAVFKKTNLLLILRYF